MSSLNHMVNGLHLDSAFPPYWTKYCKYFTVLPLIRLFTHTYGGGAAMQGASLPITT